MDLRQITYFLALSRVLNFTRAAEECHITQPALTRSVQRLEVELGGVLLLRDSSLTQLTEFGRAMLPLLEQIAGAAQLARNEAKRLKVGDRAPLRLGFSQWFAFPLLCPVLSEVVAAVRGAELSITVGSEKTLHERMLEGELDVCVGLQLGALPARFEQWQLFASDTFVFLPQDHPLASESSISAGRIAHATLLGASEPGALPETVLAYLAQHVGPGLASPHRASNWETSLQLVRERLGLGIGLSCWPVPAELVGRPLTDPAMKHEVVMTALARQLRPRAANAFVKLARARAWKA